MSQESVRVISEIYAAVNGGELHSVLHLMTTDMEYVNPPYAVEPGTRTGTEGFADAIENLRKTFPRFEYSIDVMEQHGDDVVVTVTLHNLGRDGEEMSWQRHHVWTLRDGKVCRVRWFSNAADARDAVGS
jgi:ketosteroid isomerase-like protein